MKNRRIVVIAGLMLIIGVGLWRQAVPSPEQLMNQAMVLIEGNQSTPAIPLLNRVINLEPNHSKALLLLGQLSRDSGNSSAALDYLRRIHSGSPDFSASQFLIGNIELERHRAVAAEQAFLPISPSSPFRVMAAERLIPLLGMQRRSRDVRGQLGEIRQRRDLSLPEMALWLTIDKRLTDFEVARDSLKLFWETDSNDLKSLFALCLYLSEEGAVDEAVERLRTAVQKSRSDDTIVSLLATLELKQGKQTEAAARLDRISINEQTPTPVWRACGELALASEDWNRGRLVWMYLAQQSPFDAEATYKWGQCLEMLKNRSEAEVQFRRAAQLNELSEDVETVGIMFLRKQVSADQIFKIARKLRSLNALPEAGEWARFGLHLVRSADPEMMELSKAPPVELLKLSPPVAEWNATPSNRKLIDRTPSSPAAGTVGAFHLEDIATSSGVDFQYDNGDTGLKYLVESMGGGVGAIDFDRDRWPDLFCPQGGTLSPERPRPPVSDQLFRNQGDGTFQNVTARCGLHDFDYSQGFAIGDIDNDGFDDLLVANVGACSLWLNHGDGTFEQAAGAGIPNEFRLNSSAAMADLDLDGDVDLYIAGYVDSLKVCRNDRNEISTCNPSSHSAADDYLLENLGNGTFRDVTQSAGIVAPRGKGLGVLIAHLDADSRPDIFVSNDTTPNFLYQNQSEPHVLKFQESALLQGVAFNAEGKAMAGMGIACADLDHNGELDLFVTNFFREPNSLYLRQQVVFEESTTQAGLREPSFLQLGFGTQAVDLDQDGWDELFVTNGHIDDQRALGVPWKMKPQVYATSNGQTWVESKIEGQYSQQESLGRGLMRWDFNRDGRPDLAIGHQDRPVACLENRTPQAGNSLTLRLIGVDSNRSAINARVTWKTPHGDRLAELTGGDGYYCSNERIFQLGLGQLTEIPSLTIHWPSGTVDQYQNMSAHKSYVAIEGGRLLVE